MLRFAGTRKSRSESAAFCFLLFPSPISLFTSLIKVLNKIGGGEFLLDTKKSISLSCHRSTTRNLKLDVRGDIMKKDERANNAKFGHSAIFRHPLILKAVHRSSVVQSMKK
jgi:hypothetical protein